MKISSSVSIPYTEYATEAVKFTGRLTVECLKISAVACVILEGMSILNLDSSYESTFLAPIIEEIIFRGFVQGHSTDSKKLELVEWTE